jgi:hypothetical protein
MSFNNNHISDDFSPSSGGNGSELITRQNYEEYFLLYIDHELNAAERKAVEVFVEQHPDLAEELVMLQQSVLKPDKQVTFTMKAALLQPVPENGAINETNYEGYFVLYGDNELTNAEKELVEQFVYKYPQYQAEFELLQQIKLIPDHSITYPDKNELYRTEEERRVVPFAWRKLAVAAILFLFMGGFGWYAITGNNGVQPTGPQASKPNQPATQQSTTNTQEGTTTTGDIAATRGIAATSADKQTPTQQAVEAASRKQETALAVVRPGNNFKKQRNILGTPTVPHTGGNEGITDPRPEERDLAARTVKVNVAAVDNKPAVSTMVDERSLAMSTPPHSTQPNEPFIPADDDGVYIGNVSINKAPLRGLFRKVTRVLDKATSVEPNEDSKGGIRIASFSIARNK